MLQHACQARHLQFVTIKGVWPFTHAPVVQVAAVSGLVRHQPLQSGQQLMKVAVLASAFLLSVVLGNVSLRFIPVSFSQVQLLPPALI